MTIGIDIDNTLVNSNESIYRVLQKHPEINKNITADDIDVYKDYIPEIVTTANFFPNALEVVEYFQSLGIKIVIITARNNEYNEKLDILTTDFFVSHHFNYDKIIFNQDNKAQACISEKVDVFIDDTERVLDEIERHNIKTIRFAEDDVVSKHIVMHNWLDIKEYVAKMWGEMHG